MGRGSALAKAKPSMVLRSVALACLQVSFLRLMGNVLEKLGLLKGRARLFVRENVVKVTLGKAPIHYSPVSLGLYLVLCGSSCNLYSGPLSPVSSLPKKTFAGTLLGWQGDPQETLGTL